MKFKWNEKYTTISVYSLIVIFLSIIFYHIVSEFSSFKINIGEATSVLQPFLIGFVIAYLLNFVLKIVEKKGLNHFTSLKDKPKRFLSLIITYLVVVLFLYIFIAFVFPQLASSVIGLVNNIPYYVNNMRDLFESSSHDIILSDKYLSIIMEKWNEFLNYVVSFTTDLLPLLGDIVKGVASSISNIALGLIISIYLLLDKERFFALGRKISFAIFSSKIASKILNLVHRTNDIFGRFISGKLLDSLIIGIITFFILSIFKMPYAILISFIIGITNIIPFFGPFIGAIPSFFIILFVAPVKAFWFLLIVLFIQQLDGNIIGPKILGDSIGISAFWILFSLLIGSKLFGIIGMIIGVPLFAVIYSIFKDFIENRLKKKDFPTDTDQYIKKSK